MQQTILDLWKAIIASKNILMINHIRMDPDAFGSLTAFYYILESKWYHVAAINDMMPPESFSFLGASDIFRTDLNIAEFNPDLIISFDASSLDQLWDQYKNNLDIFNNIDFYVIDHHASNHGFGQYNIVDPEASSTCEITLKIIEELWLQDTMTPKIATLLTAGLHTDTNIYYNQNTSADTLRAWAKLMEYWADFRAPMFEFFKKKTFNKTKLWGQLLSNIQQDSWIFYWIITQEMFNDTQTTNEDASGIINEFLANMEGMKICFLVYPLPKWESKVSIRSAKTDVSKIASSHSWGWHKLAAWYQTNLSPQQTADDLLQQLKKEL